MPKPESAESATMIIPQGTEIEVDARGQLSISTPGNLVLQNSGTFGALESVNGSIRIEQGVEIEAATVRCADACYIRGSLTAWKVTARSLHLEDEAQAHIVLQETEAMDVGRGARLVGNFGSEDELFVLFSRFADQVKSLPIATSRRRRARNLSGEGEAVRALAAGPEEEPETLPEALSFAQALLARELAAGELQGAARRVVRELVKLLEERDVETLRHTHRALFAKLPQPGDRLKKASWLVADHFDREEDARPPRAE